MISPSATRVQTNTPEHLNVRIRARTVAEIEHYAEADPETLRRRLDELDQEWDIERVLMTQAATLSLTGVALALLTKRRSPLALSAAVLGFLLQHAIQGWCPPVRPLRALGVRTPREIEDERHALLQYLEERASDGRA